MSLVALLFSYGPDSCRPLVHSLTLRGQSNLFLPPVSLNGRPREFLSFPYLLPTSLCPHPPLSIMSPGST